MEHTIELLKKEIKEKQNELEKLEALNADIPLVVGKTYTTKMATAEKFTLTQILINKKGVVTGLKGMWETCPHLGECGLGADRLLSKTGTINL